MACRSFVTSSVLSVRLSLGNATFSYFLSLDFLIFGMMVSHYKQRKVTKLDFRKNVLPKLAQTCPEMAQNEVFGCLLGHNAFIVIDIAYLDQQS